MPHSVLLGRVVEPGEPQFLPEDRAKLHAYWQWRREHCAGCNQRRSDWTDADGKELIDPPFEIAIDICPACSWLEEWQDEHPHKDRPAGARPYFQRLDDDPPASGEDE